MAFEKMSNLVGRVSGFFKPGASEQLFHAVEMADHRTALQLIKENPKSLFTTLSADKLYRNTKPLQGLELSPLQLACYNYDIALLNSFYQAIADDPQAKNEFTIHLCLFKSRYSIRDLKSLYVNRSWAELTKHQQEELPVVFLKEFCTQSNWYKDYDFAAKLFNEPVYFTYLDFHQPSKHMLINDHQLNFNYVLCRHEQYRICSCIVEAPIGSMMEDLAGFISLHEQRQQQLDHFLTELKAVAENHNPLESIPSDGIDNNRCTIL